MSSSLFDLAVELVSIPSVSHHEAALASRVESELRACSWLEVFRIGDNVIARTDQGCKDRIILAGHLDTVPPLDNVDVLVEGDRLQGLGAVDMKGGLAVLLDLARSGSPRETDVSWVFYVCEEVARKDSGLLTIWNEAPHLLQGSAAILAEPTGLTVEAGCQGTMTATVTLRGQRAHTARPYRGINAIHRLVPLLEILAAYTPRVVVLEGCSFKEALQAVKVYGGVASNVVPDEVVLTFNYRFAPDRGTQEAVAYLEGLFDRWLDPEMGDSLEVKEVVGGAMPQLDNPFLNKLVSESRLPPRGKLGWTDVAFFAERGIPAANFGPGDPDLAHTPHEYVERSSLEAARAVLGSLIASPK